MTKLKDNKTDHDVTKKKMCYMDLEELSPDDYVDGWENGISGTPEHITRYADGTTTRHGGGPAGPMHYDKYGNEC